jgi:hypothetical protein
MPLETQLQQAILPAPGCIVLTGLSGRATASVTTDDATIIWRTSE